MNQYIYNRLLADARNVINQSQNESLIGHSVIKGRNREILVNNMLKPWLPPYVKCGTGSIIDAFQNELATTQDDVILYDTTLAPPITHSEFQTEGLFLYESVLARIEVKSTLNVEGIRQFLASSYNIAKLKISVNVNSTGTINFLFAYNSDLLTAPKNEIIRFLKCYEQFISPKSILDNLPQFQSNTSGLISVICIVNKGLWKLHYINGEIVWAKLDENDVPENDLEPRRIAYFNAIMSNTCFHEHTSRLGLDPTQSLGSGIGNYLDSPFSSI